MYLRPVRCLNVFAYQTEPAHHTDAKWCTQSTSSSDGKCLTGGYLEPVLEKTRFPQQAILLRSESSTRVTNSLHATHSAMNVMQRIEKVDSGAASSKKPGSEAHQTFIQTLYA